MINIPNYQITKQIYENNSSLFYRALRNEDNQAVILKILKENPPPEEVTRYRQEYDILRRLTDLEGVVEAYSLNEHKNMWVMCLEDFGGKSLKMWIEEKSIFTFDELLTFAARATEILEQIHRQKIVHMDINPSNIILDPTSGVLKIMGFGISTQLSKQHLSLNNPNIPEGTLAYISPEQTGRMNHALDYRTDYYSLGATFYELFTGVVPFATTDAMELVHCHIAKRPKPPIQINPDLPPVISNLILKLLEKNPEERYQSAWGVKTDLEQCLKKWQTTGQIEPFPLARFDLSEQFHIPQKLYGRDHEIKTLLSAIERVTFMENDERKQKRSKMILVTGYSGIGKSLFVKETYNFLAKKHGYFITGKFDKLQRNVPYSAIVNAFKELVGQLLTENEDQLVQWKEKLSLALGYNGKIIIDVIPNIELIIGPQPEVLQLGPTESQNRFISVFQHFIRVFCQPEHPLVIFLDDVQWVDSATLILLEQMLIDRDNTSLFLICAYRDNEVDSTHPLIMALDKLRKEHFIIDQITLKTLTYRHVNQLIADTLHQKKETVAPLTDLVMRKTGGNPFFVNQFLHTLHDEDLLHYVVPTTDQNGHWQWDIEYIEHQKITDNVVDLMIGKLKKMPSAAQQVLRLAACVGNRFDLDTLSVIYGKSTTNTFQDLMPIISEGLILPLSEPTMIEHKMIGTEIPYLQFLHDRVQEAAYALIKDDKKKKTHLQIGRLLVQEINKNVLKKRIFEITDHFNIAVDLITDDSEKIDVAHLNLTAGQKAISAMASQAALQYFQTGFSLLSKKGWEEHYSLAFNLTCGLIESSYLTTSYQQAIKLCHTALSKAQSIPDKAKIYSLMCNNFTLENKMEEALETGLKALKILNIPILENPPEIVHVDQLRDLPEMTNPNELAAMSILVSIISCALVTQSPLMMPLIHTMVNLSANHGNCSKAPFGYVWYGSALCWSRADISLGFRFGRLAIDVMEKFKPCEVETTVLHQFNSFIRHWCEHERLSINEFPHVVQIGKETGDIEYGTYVAVNYVANLLLVGEPLAITQEKQRPYLDWVSDTRFSFSFMYGSIWAQATQCLMSKSDRWALLQGDFMDEREMIPEMQKTKNNLNLFAVYAAKAMLSYFNARFHESAAFAKEAEQYETAIGGLLPVTQPPFYGALARLKVMSDSTSEESDSYKTIDVYEEKLRLWSEKGHKNFQHKYDLVRAEKARVLGKNWNAAQLYEKAIAGAKENEYLHEEALSCELAAEFYFGRGMDLLAQTYIKEAHYGYKQWGALGKIEDLEAKYPSLLSLKTAEAIPQDTTIPATQMVSTFKKDRSEWMDLNSIMKASQSLSGEIVLNRFLDKMIHIMIENTGAEKGFLMLPKQESWFIEAEGYIDSSDTTVLKSLSLEESEQVSANIINYVARTRENVILHDSAQESRFAHDAYIVKHRPKSVLCVPLVNQGQLTGILYFENNLTTWAFTPEKLEVLNLLSSQIAISIENSLLYNNLENKVAERTSKLEQEIVIRKRAEEAAKASSQAKSTFLANMSHEIRTPLNAMFGFSQMLKDQHYGPLNRKQIEHVNHIIESSNRLLFLINGILDLSRVEAGKIEITNAVFSIDNLLERITTTYSIEVAKKSISFQIEVASNVPKQLVGDVYRIEQVLKNLVGNAFKFTEKGKIEVLVKMKSATDEVIFEVRDTGIGIPKDKIDGIFNKFYQIDSSYAKRFAGAGLGLTISKELVELMGGKIWVESEVGKSTSFYFSLEADIPEADMVALDQKGKMFTEPIKHKKSLRILLAEDDELSSQTMTYFLKKEGHTITHVVNGNEVLSALETDVFDIILMDVQMPEMDGVEATKQIRSCDTAKFDPKIPIIALTAYAMRGDKEKFLNAGMNDYATKPVDIDNLFEKMSQLVSAGRSFEAGVEDYSISSAEADDYIIEIQRFINNTRGAQEFLKEMLDEYSIRMNRLEKAILSKDTKEIELAIHKFIALFSAIFINSAIKISRDLLNAAKSNDLENCEHLFLDLKTKMQKIVNHIKTLGI